MSTNQGIVTTRTPFRISFFGGGTDFPDYFNQNGGSVIGAAIDKYIYVTLNSLERFFEKRIRLSYSKLEFVDHPDELEHSIVKHVLLDHPFFGDQSFLDIHTYADLPASSGVGSSSSFTVGMLNALYLINGIYKTPKYIAQEAIKIEREKIKHSGGWQDQIFAAFGGLNRITFTNNNFSVEPICLSLDKKRALENACMIFFTGDLRSSDSVQKIMLQNKEEDKKQFLDEIHASVEQAFEILYHSSSIKELIIEFGQLLNHAWQAKKQLSPLISNDKIDTIYEMGIRAGAIGGKLCGAGSGGFLLFIVPEEKRANVASALSDYKQLNITFQEQGSQVIYSRILNGN